METTIKVTKTASIPDANKSTNFGGICNDGNTIYCCKTNQGESITTIYKLDNYADKTPVKKKFTTMGHSNGLTYWNGFLYAPAWSKSGKTKGNSISKIDVKKWTKTKVTGSGSTFTSIAHYKDDLFIVGSGGGSFQVIKMGAKSYTVSSKFSVSNPKKAKGYTVSQDIYYKDGKLYIMMTKSDLKHGCILIVDISNLTNGKAYTPCDIWIYSSLRTLEIESMCVDKSGHILFGANSTSDGIYRKK